MTKMLSKNPKVFLQDIKQFEQEYEVPLDLCNMLIFY